ncbi:MAG: hypothetical protein GC149_02270 [Gammaproteobacteria bacterium]|nr:hypothetical protein [Gammaproteobacteria bacterium]
MTTTFFKYHRLIVLLAVVQLAGCASMQPLSNFARTGDTVMVSLGGTDSNALVSVLKKEDVNVSITDAAGNTYPVKVRNVFRVFSDPTSHYAYQSPSSSYSGFESFVDPYQGQWMAVLDLVDPGTDQPLALAVGQASFNISSQDLRSWVDYPGYGWSWTNGDLASIPIEIIAGTGSKNPLNYLAPISLSPLDSLEPEPQVEVTANGTPGAMIGGGMFVFRYVMSDFNNAKPRVFSTSPDPNVQLASATAPQGDGTALLTVMISNPHGFNVNNRKEDQNGNNVLLAGSSLLRSLRFSIVWANYNNTVTDANWQNSLSMVSGRYVDLQGNTMSELTPVLSKVR